MADDDEVVPGKVYQKVSGASPKPTLLVFFAEGDCVVYYQHLDLWKYFLDPMVPNLEPAPDAVATDFILAARRALFNALQAR
jgi:hypothetical protein